MYSTVVLRTLRVKSVMFCTVMGRMTFWPIITSLNLTNGRPPSETTASDGFTDGQWMSSHSVFAGLHGTRIAYNLMIHIHIHIAYSVNECTL